MLKSILMSSIPFFQNDLLSTDISFIFITFIIVIAVRVLCNFSDDNNTSNENNKAINHVSKKNSTNLSDFVRQYFDR